MRNIEGVIFDWAGTTVDFGCFAPVRAFLEVFREAGVEANIDEARAPMGLLKRDHIRAMLNTPQLRNRWEMRSWADLDALSGEEEPPVPDLPLATDLMSGYFVVVDTADSSSISFSQDPVSACASAGAVGEGPAVGSGLTLSTLSYRARPASGARRQALSRAARTSPARADAGRPCSH